MAEKSVTPGSLSYNLGGLCNKGPAAFMLQDFFVLPEIKRLNIALLYNKIGIFKQHSFLSTPVGIIQTVKNL